MEKTRREIPEMCLVRESYTREGSNEEEQGVPLKERNVRSDELW